MKRFRRIGAAALLGLLTLLASGCYSRYVITTTTGNKIVTRGKPRQVDSNFVYRNASGDKVAISAMRVRVIEPYSKDSYHEGLRTLPELQ